MTALPSTPLARIPAAFGPAPGLPLRAMGVADVPAVLRVEALCYSHPWSRGNFVDSIAAGHLAQLLEVEGELIGYFIAMAGADEWHLLNLTVAREREGRGLGSWLLDAVAAAGRARGLATLWLEVRASNHRARALYARHGFSEVGLRRGYYPASAGREDAVLMRRELATTPLKARDGVD